MTAEEYLKKVEDKFNEVKAAGLNRRSLEWGVFSGAINRELRSQLAATDPEEKESRNLRLAFGCWMAMSKLLGMSPVRRLFFSERHRKDIKMLKKAMEL